MRAHPTPLIVLCIYYKTPLQTYSHSLHAATRRQRFFSIAWIRLMNFDLLCCFLVFFPPVFSRSLILLSCVFFFLTLNPTTKTPCGAPWGCIIRTNFFKIILAMRNITVIFEWKHWENFGAHDFLVWWNKKYATFYFNLYFMEVSTIIILQKYLL